MDKNTLAAEFLYWITIREKRVETGYHPRELRRDLRLCLSLLDILEAETLTDEQIAALRADRLPRPASAQIPCELTGGQVSDTTAAKIMRKITEQALAESRKPFHCRRVATMLRALHNLPRAYFSSVESPLLASTRLRLPMKEAISYAESEMKQLSHE